MPALTGGRARGHFVKAQTALCNRSRHALGRSLLLSRLVWPVLAVCLFSAETTPHQSQEYQIKAAFLLNFAMFVEWPPSAFENAHSPIAICVVGADPFGGVLDRLLEGQVVNGRKLVARRLQRVPAGHACQVVFVSPSEKDARGILAGLGPGVLSVGDRAGFLREGGIIGFVVENNHIRFDIDQRAAAKAALTISARLLSVARQVVR
jgi:YfiR/HmsC-like